MTTYTYRTAVLNERDGTVRYLVTREEAGFGAYTIAEAKTNDLAIEIARAMNSGNQPVPDEASVVVNHLRCGRCGKAPWQLTEYVDAAAVDGISPNEYVRDEEGTYDPASNRFLCTECYVAVGQPSLFARQWKATPENLRALGSFEPR